MRNYQNIIAAAVFFVLSLIIVIPLFAPGYILTLDMVMAEKTAFPDIGSASFLFSLFFWLLHLLFPVHFLQKAILFLIFFLSGFSLYKLLPEKYGRARIFGGLFYAINPFVYERVMAGQWQLLLGYSILPYVLSAVVDFFHNPSRKTAIKLGIMSTLLIVLFIHYSFVLFWLIVIYGTVYIFYNRQKLSTLLKFLLFFVMVFLVFNLNWVVSLFLVRSELMSAFSQFSQGDLLAFQSVADSRFGLIFNLLSGYGFWPEVYDYFIIPKNIVGIWPLVALTIIGISLYGFIRLIQEKDKSIYPFLLTFAVLFIISLDFAGGIALKSFANTIFFLYDKIPVLRGLREPQKLIGVLIFSYAYFGSIGLDYLVKKLTKPLRIIIFILFFLIPFVYTPTIFSSFWNQLKPTSYPDSWYKVNDILKQDSDTGLVVFFPWHQYMRYNFSNNLVIANPAPQFFDKPILSSLNYETEPLYTHEIRPEALHVDGLLRIQFEKTNLLGQKVDFTPDWATDLSVIGVKYIILAKDADWQKYDFLDKSPGLVKILESEDLLLYQNQVPPTL